MASIVVCAEPGSWQQASRFAQRALGNAELKSFEALRRRAPIQPLLSLTSQSVRFCEHMICPVSSRSPLSRF